MFNFYKTFPFILVLACYSSTAFAILDAVIVSAARTEQSTVSTPTNIAIITRQDIESSGAVHVVDVLRGQSGVLIEDTFGDGSRAVISMRGFSGSTSNSNTLILVDGRRLNNTDISNPDLNSIPLKDIERIEIIQGGSGVLYGDQAVGGTVNIITKKLIGKTGAIAATVGSYEAKRVRASFGDGVGDDFKYNLSTEIRQSDNYRRQNNEIDYFSLFAKSEYKYTGGTVAAEFQKVNEDLRTPGALIASDVAVDRRQTIVDFLNDFTDSKTDVIRLGLKHKLSSNWSLEGEATTRNVDRTIQQSFRGFAILTPKKLMRKQTEFTPRFIGIIPGQAGDVRVTAGIDVIATNFDSEITTSSDDQLMLAEYIQVVYPVHEQFHITTGFRHAKVEDDITSTYTNGKQDAEVNVFEIGASLDVTYNLKLVGRFEQNFRFAKVDELTYVSPGALLKPQTGSSVEIGAQYISGEISYNVMTYHLSLKDEIAFDSSAPQPVGAPFAGANVNFDPTTHQGVLLDMQYAVLPSVNVSANYTYTDARFDSGVYAGKAISGVAENSAKIGLGYRYSNAVNINLDAVYVGSRYLDGDNSNVLNKIPQHTVLNSNILYSYQNLKMGLKINNITNQKYFENANSFGSLFPSPERNFLLTVNWKFR